MNNTNTAAAHDLRNLAVANNELPFAHMCTLALADEPWAVSCLESALSLMTAGDSEGMRLALIRFTDATPPDGEGTPRGGIAV